MEKTDLEKLKERYNLLEKEYSIPSFDVLNKEFQIERLYKLETDFLLKEVRKIVFGKLFDYMRFFESLLQPQNASIFHLIFIKSMGLDGKQIVEEFYKKMVKMELDISLLDLKYHEKDEAEMINKGYNFWKGNVDEIVSLFESVKKNLDVKIDKNTGGYLG